MPPAATCQPYATLPAGLLFVEGSAWYRISSAGIRAVVKRVPYSASVSPPLLGARHRRRCPAMCTCDPALVCDTQELDARVRTINGAIGELCRLSVGVRLYLVAV